MFVRGGTFLQDCTGKKDSAREKYARRESGGKKNQVSVCGDERGAGKEGGLRISRRKSAADDVPRGRGKRKKKNFEKKGERKKKGGI